MGSGRRNAVGGPVCTRTADRALHVNVVPETGRHCNLDCVYCPFASDERFQRWPRPGDVGAAVMNALRDAPDLESITLSGPGDPTLHPRFGAVLGDVLSARRVREGLPVRVVTNAYRLLDPYVRRLVGFADECIVRIDAGGGRIARPPAGASPDALRGALEEISSFSVESVFVDGPGGNANERDVGTWVEFVAALGPERVYVTTLAASPVEPGTRRVSPGTLERIAVRLRSVAECEVAVVP